MPDPRDLIKAVAVTSLPARIRRYKFMIHDGQVRRNMLGAEVMPAPCEGEVLYVGDGWAIQKTGLATFAAHAEHLLPRPLVVGERVRVEHAGFAGTDLHTTSATDGVTTTRINRKRLVSPKDFPVLNDLAEQLSELPARDGRRGLHVLHDLRFADLQADGSDDSNPWLSFSVQGAKFTGTVRIEYVWGADVYQLQFRGDGVSEDVDYVHFDQLVDLIEDRCDSTSARQAKVTPLSSSRRKAATPAA